MKEQHEAVYKTLKSEKYHGWGGAKYTERMVGLEENMNLLLDSVQLQGREVLELGSGAGDLSIKMHDRGYHVTGVEFSLTAVEWSNEKKMNRSIDFICDSVTNMNLLRDKTFDLILDGNCLHCLFDEDRQRFYENVVYWLEDEGYFYMASVAAKVKGQKTKVGPIPRCFKTVEELKKEAESYKLKCVKEWCVEHETYNHFRAVFKKEKK